MSSPVWLITGASSGFGLLLCLRALKAGHRVIGTMRNPTRAREAVKAIQDAGGKVVEMDMTESQASIMQKVEEAEATYGQIDVLVNNAAFAMLGGITEFTEEEVNSQFQTNLYGPIFAVQGVLPGMRRRRGGTIVNVSSLAGQEGHAMCGLYSASKFALEGFSEALEKEEAASAISVLIVEPGLFRTNFLNSFVAGSRSGSAQTEVAASGQAKPTTDRWRQEHGKQRGDPDKAADFIFQVVAGEGGDTGKLKGKILRLPLGEDAVDRIEAKLRRVEQDVGAAKHAGACATDF